MFTQWHYVGNLELATVGVFASPKAADATKKAEAVVKNLRSAIAR